MMERTAYVFNELDKAFGEGRRLSAQAQAFVDIELPGLLGKIRPDSCIADFGCGTGVISAALAQSLPDATVVGLDMDEKALSMACQHGQGLANLSFEHYGFGSAQEPKSGPFDVAFTRLVLLHLPDPAAAITQMGRCLKPGGLLYLVDCDDDYVNFKPEEEWQGHMINFMKLAQSLRGGTRTLGSKLLKLVADCGFWPEGSQVVYYSTKTLGLKRWTDIFLPALGNLAQHDLQFLAERGQLSQQKAEALKQQMTEFLKKPGVQAQLSTWHVWARKA